MQAGLLDELRVESAKTNAKGFNVEGSYILMRRGFDVDRLTCEGFQALQLGMVELPMFVARKALKGRFICNASSVNSIVNGLSAWGDSCAFY